MALGEHHGGVARARHRLSGIVLWDLFEARLGLPQLTGLVVEVTEADEQSGVVRVELAQLLVLRDQVLA